jgi:hypothetical protein
VAGVGLGAVVVPAGGGEVAAGGGAFRDGRQVVQVAAVGGVVAAGLAADAGAEFDGGVEFPGRESAQFGEVEEFSVSSVSSR